MLCSLGSRRCSGVIPEHKQIRKPEILSGLWHKSGLRQSTATPAGRDRKRKALQAIKQENPKAQGMESDLETPALPQWTIWCASGFTLLGLRCSYQLTHPGRGAEFPNWTLNKLLFSSYYKAQLNGRKYQHSKHKQTPVFTTEKFLKPSFQSSQTSSSLENVPVEDGLKEHRDDTHSPQEVFRYMRF